MPDVILVVDDDADVRAALRRTLRGFDVVEAASPGEAIETMRGRAFDAVVSDYSLGTDTDGLDLLQHVRVMYPTTVRFLVTGNRELDVVTRALNEGAVDRYFLKPWSDSKLRSALEIVLASRC